MLFLRDFEEFNLKAFLQDKKLVAMGQVELKDNATGARIGTKIDVGIVEDRTKYNRKDGDTRTNCFEKLAVKVKKDITIPANTVVRLVGATATVYGDYRNQLSIWADDVVAVDEKVKSNVGA